ncbi:response regulator [Flavihumibacter petaseus]|uniref:Putative two-component response regulator n=1 Tax=Flavihumibacter petaseus NBRC 106054 TaxID=1220578 RepID=A0A0E9N849_9BACT|nr:response regulator [Flavihumibacter petaseus]GAO45555.1 putative two-component response regulator [Flavihumibacter petaseus NBRC 106054]
MEKKINIFYTDDDQDDVFFFEEAVKEASRSLNVFTTFDGGSLLYLLDNPPPEPAVIFLDWNMPGINGAETLKRIRMNERTREIPVVIFSTSDDRGNIEHSRELGANLYVTKPNAFNDIVKMIRHCMAVDWNNFRAGEEDFVFKLN